MISIRLDEIIFKSTKEQYAQFTSKFTVQAHPRFVVSLPYSSYKQKPKGGDRAITTLSH